MKIYYAIPCAPAQHVKKTGNSHWLLSSFNKIVAFLKTLMYTLVVKFPSSNH